MRRSPIRLKVGAALAVPACVLLGVVYAKVSHEAGEVRDVRRQADLATALIGPQGVLSSLQDERNWTMVELIGAADAINLDSTGYKETRGTTDQAVTDFATKVASSGGVVAEEYQPAIDALEDLDDIRQAVDDHDEPRSFANVEFGSEIFARYATIIDVFFRSGTSLALEVDHPDLRAGAELVDVSSRQIEVIGALSYITLTSVDGLSDEDLIDVGARVNEFANNAATLQRHDRGPYEELVTSGFPHTFTANMTAAIEDATSTGTVDLDVMLDLLDVEEEDSYVRFVDDATMILDDEADRLVSAAERSQTIYLTLAAGVILLTILASWLAARSITRPLQSLTSQATAMANDRLPRAVRDILETGPGEDVALARVEAVAVVSRDETADVAAALNVVQDAALTLAVEQTMMRRNISDSFVNLGRRNQNLLSRQLDFITEIEQTETDPEVLADLFRLDHLATRMRRNAESLLVLADLETPRKWASPVRVNDVIRAALGEVEDFQRVTFRTVQPVTITGTAAADLAHLLAELLENALAFSPPHQDVAIYGYRGRQGEYTLAIVDSGLGLRPDELTRANRRLAGAESFTVAPSKYLGHYVAGNLAARHGIRIELQDTPGYGTTALAYLPSDILAADQAAVSSDAARSHPDAVSRSGAPSGGSLGGGPGPGALAWPHTGGMPWIRSNRD